MLSTENKFETKRLCETCEKTSCCTGFDAPFLFESDIKKLHETGFSEKEFSEEIKVSNVLVKSLKKKNNSDECIFWDGQTKKCSVYDKRPFDCKMFPFDIMKIDGELMWIVFSCNPKSDWSWTEDYLLKLENDKNFVEIIKNIEIFQHTLETERSKDHPLPYTALRKVRRDLILSKN